jgi:hypothetical protein
MQDKQLEYREEVRRAKYRESLNESSRVGKSLLEAIAKRSVNVL